MKIYVYCEDKNEKTYLDVPEEECTVMIQTDYERRLREADDDEEVMPRTVQEILDEEINKPTFNNNQTETRRHCSMDAMLEEGFDFISEKDIVLAEEKYAELRVAIAQLKPEQQELIRKVFYDEIKQNEVAENMGIKKAALSRRLSRIYKQLKELLTTTDTE